MKEEDVRKEEEQRDEHSEELESLKVRTDIKAGGKTGDPETPGV
ncbi:MAG TPA: hypothetical protein VJS44_07700 [Pyrinomonadaceae bacterium]|nr:hypothetical protein [Pyrinomonadaceae bacterium]